jgi:hypothetical protein
MIHAAWLRCNTAIVQIFIILSSFALWAAMPMTSSWPALGAKELDPPADQGRLLKSSGAVDHEIRLSLATGVHLFGLPSAEE